MVNTEFQFTQSTSEVVLRDRFQLLNTISPLERWEDNNYRPGALKVEIQNSDHHFLVKAELPGLQPEQVKVHLYRGTLLLLVTAILENGASEEQYAEIPIPAHYRTDKAHAIFRHGVLTIAFAPRRREILKQFVTALNGLLPQPRLSNVGVEDSAAGD